MRLFAIALFVAGLLGCSHPGGHPVNAEFRYMADAPLIQLCGSGQRYPVAMDQNYLELEKAYLGSQVEPGAPVGIDVIGEVQLRPAMEGDRQIETYVVTKLNGVFPDQACPESTQPASK
jgi:copper homeostasis protein (lipoprotein)